MKQSIKHRLAATFMVTALFILLASFIGIHKTMKEREAIHRVYGDNNLLTSAVNHLRFDIMSARVEQLTMMLESSANEKIAHRNEILALADDTREDFEAAISGEIRDVVRNKLIEAKAGWEEFRDTRDNRLFSLIMAGKAKEADILAAGIQEERYIRIMKLLEEVSPIAEDEMHHQQKKMEENWNGMVLGIVVFMSIGFLLTIGSLYAYSSNIIARIKELDVATQKISEGELTSRALVTGSDEIASLGITFNTMADILQNGTETLINKEKELQEKNVKLQEAVVETQQQKEILEWASMRREEQNKQLEETVKSLEATNRQLAETQAQLVQSEKMASVGQLAAGVAHEINNPIGYVNGNLSTLDSYLRDIKTLMEKFNEAASAVYEGKNDDLIWLLEDIERFKAEKDLDFAFDDIPKLMAESREGLGMVTSIVKDLKEFSHVEESEMKEFNVNRELDNTISVIWNQVKVKAGIEKEYGDVPHIKGYPRQLNHAFMNMLLNAANAVEKSTCDGSIRISTRHENETVIIEISDNGCGIPEEHLPKVFEPFFTTKPVGKGKGLGLCSVYNAVKKHNGEIDIRSKVGEGTTFIIKLPVDKRGADTVVLR